MTLFKTIGVVVLVLGTLGVRAEEEHAGTPDVGVGAVQGIQGGMAVLMPQPVYDTLGWTEGPTVKCQKLKQESFGYGAAGYWSQESYFDSLKAKALDQIATARVQVSEEVAAIQSRDQQQRQSYQDTATPEGSKELQRLSKELREALSPKERAKEEKLYTDAKSAYDGLQNALTGPNIPDKYRPTVIKYMHVLYRSFLGNYYRYIGLESREPPTWPKGVTPQQMVGRDAAYCVGKTDSACMNLAELLGKFGNYFAGRCNLKP